MSAKMYGPQPELESSPPRIASSRFPPMSPQSTNKIHNKQTGVTANEAVNMIGTLSMAASGPSSMGDGSASSGLTPGLDPMKAIRFQKT